MCIDGMLRASARRPPQDTQVVALTAGYRSAFAAAMVIVVLEILAVLALPGRPRGHGSQQAVRRR
jgi:hypothetical protein